MAKKRERKTTVKTTALVKSPQPHGGALNIGGTSGNRGGSGRPPSALRADLRDLLDTHGRAKLVKLLKGKRTDDSTVLRAIEIAAKYGLGSVHEVSAEEVRAQLRRTMELLQRELLPADFARLLPMLKEIWS